MKVGLIALLGLLAPGPAWPDPSAQRFREANEWARAGDYPRALSGYAAIAASGTESASLYWNWAQAAAARGAQGEALWALLRARELEPGDRVVSREADRLRQALNLDPAEVAPEPMAGAARLGRRFRLDLVAVSLLAFSILAHAVALARAERSFGRLATLLFAIAAAVAAVPAAGSLARPTATVVRRAAPLFDAASPSAEPTGSLREGEVVPILEASGDWLRVEDGAGARGWARAEDARPIGRTPHVAD